MNLKRRQFMQQYHTDTERVENLIDSYREAVGGSNSENVKAIKNYEEIEEKRIYAEIEKRTENGEDIPFFEVDVEYPIELENKIRVNEQLLGHFYAKVAADSADKGVLLQLLADYYDSTFFSDEEEAFLTDHYKDVINYIIKTSHLIFQEYSDLKDAHLLPFELLDLVAKIIEIPVDSIIYNPFAGFAHLASALNRNHFICEESYTVGRDRSRTDKANWLWAWMQVALFANNSNAVIYDDNEMPSFYDYVISYIPFTSIDFFTEPNENTLKGIRSKSCDATIVSKIQSIYQNLTNKGKMVLAIPDY